MIAIVHLGTARTNPGTEGVDRFVAGVEPSLRGIVRALRSVVRETAPDLREEIVMGTPTYSLKGYVCCIAAYTRAT